MASGEDLGTMIFDISGTGAGTMKNYVAYIIKIN
jgi:hypothetical protein